MNKPDNSLPRARWRAFLAPLLIIGLCLVAWWGCLSADFYMDDFLFLVKDDRSGPIERSWLVLGIPVLPNTNQGALTVDIFQLIPTLMAMASEKLAAAPGFQPEYYHVWNLLLHTVAAVMAFLCGRSLLAAAAPEWSAERRQRASVIGALLFAMHPLCSEPVNYAKCTNSLTVTVFSLAALHGLFRLLDGGGSAARRWLIGGSVLTVFSYFFGSVLLAGWVSLIVLWHWRRPGARPWKAEAGAAAAWVRATRPRLVGISLLAAAVLVFWCHVVHRQVTLYGPTLFSHWLTQGRVFWDYLALMVWPAALCSDRLEPWSTSPRDVEAVVKLVGCFVLAGGLLWWLPRARSTVKRLAVLLAALCLLPLGIRFLYMNFEVMVEYRVYPCLPWLGLGAGCLLAWMWEKNRVIGPVIAAGLVAASMVRSMQRTATWGSQGLLAEDVLARYPGNPRAMLQLQMEQFTVKHYHRVRALHDALLAGWVDSFGENRGGIPGRRLVPASFQERFSDSCYLMVHVTAEQEGMTAAEKWAEETRARLLEVAPQSFQSGGRQSTAWSLDEGLRRAREADEQRRRARSAASSS